MLENRPIVVIAIGYIIGIIMGLYCKISIVFLYLILGIIYVISFLYSSKLRKPINKKFKLISFRRYFRYIKIIITKKVFILILISSIFSNTITLYKNEEYSKIQNKLDGTEIQVEAIITSNAENKKYINMYKAKIDKINSKTGEGKSLENKKIYLNIRKKDSDYIKYGDRIKITGIFTKPQSRTNHKAFDYREYLQSVGIYGILDAKHIQKESDDEKNLSLRY